MIRRAPRSTLFPYKTRFLSQAEDGIRDWSVTGVQTYAVFCFRSEEHTSELQSLTNLACRLLLEKKKRIECAQLTELTTMFALSPRTTGRVASGTTRVDIYTG